ncbi:hypothetical protein HPP92_011693 [Vanilla planifolia]|uniref:Uncharacterized protein n=1 Tax=Vanilla planifolia TaxID=51239 RepID=A0A835V195_VANPL|nr:hypothetical protein HPP92_011693 [Vanilla planifolia]
MDRGKAVLEAEDDEEETLEEVFFRPYAVSILFFAGLKIGCVRRRVILLNCVCTLTCYLRGSSLSRDPVLLPLGASGVVLMPQESSKLLSAVAIALSNCSSNWPAFVPVHVPSRKAYIGIQNMGTIFTRRFDADRIGSQVPVRLMHLEGLYELFVSKFALTSVDFSTNYFHISSTMRLTYRTPPFDDDDTEQLHREGKEDGVDLNDTKKQWDYSCPWAKWYSAEDPFKGFELIAIWPNKMFDSSLEMAELENESPFDAEKWFLLPIVSQRWLMIP